MLASTVTVDAGAGTRGGASRAATCVVWIAILAPLPYSASRLSWAVGIPVGYSSEGLRELDIPGRGSLAVLVLVLLAETTAVFVHAIVLSRARTVPRWVPLLRGRALRPRLVTGLLLAPVAVLAYALAISLATSFGLVEPPDAGPNHDGWAGTWLTAVVFAVWFPALVATTLIYRHRSR